MSQNHLRCLLGGLCLVCSNLLMAGVSENGIFQNAGQWYLQQGATTVGPIVPDQIVVRRTDRQPVSRQSMLARGYSLVSSVTEMCPPYYVLELSSSDSYSLYQSLTKDQEYDLVDYDRVGELEDFAMGGAGDGDPCYNYEIFEGDPLCIERTDGYPNDGGFKHQTYLVLHRVLDAWDITRGDPSVLLAVVDSGVDVLDQDLHENIFVNAAEDLNHNGRPDFTPVSLGGDLDGLDNDGNGFADDLTGWNFKCNDNRTHSFQLPHGTAVASIIAGMGNSCHGISGIAGGWGTGYLTYQEGTFVKGVSLMPVAVADEGSFKITSVMKAIRYAAENGAKIINLSLGWNDDLTCVRECLRDLMSTYDFILVAAAGNSDSNNSAIQYPAAYPGVMTVGACELNGSAPVTGPRKGPSMNIIAQRPALADDTNRFHNCGIATTTQGGVETPHCFGGSSASTPQVSATVGLMLSVNPYLTREEAMFILDATAAKIEMQGNYFTCASGYGTLDAFAAVNEAELRTIPDTLNLNQSLSSGYVGKAYETITTGGSFRLSSGRQAVLHAGEQIVFGPGSTIAYGSNFRADVGYHETCPTLVQTD